MNILLTNDDGIHAPGLMAVLDVLKSKAKCVVVAPNRERSATSHAISLYHQIHVQKHPINESIEGYAVDGTAADCVKFGIFELGQKNKFDLVISGINPGLNTGISVYYSGTIGAAREGLINGVPAMAVSQDRALGNDFSYGAGLVLNLFEGYLSGQLPKDVLLNVNIPALDGTKIKGIKSTNQAPSRFAEWYELQAEDQAKQIKSYALKGDIHLTAPDGTSDEEALREGFVSITPLGLDTTCHKKKIELKTWLGFNNGRKR
ncbi:MAG: 5'/3'-nucleotidase SurE [Candidatus Omnitrophica bacterium CG11_big_fil_rev_8_21_14_0_20_45_26]|uniref:5'-nucleotidase SurE n=1 Tax=Candidatus Abzuiibacterium crystallinum TaxID=1974748 RepID=A0A2H0LNA9_9BACT|nr:MAG: 5'/3'-nucleotidase SurE [Candidatus Omnitrophica bacterium CG11_big_fil_rev_8_21_14_0_20_45_26]PIW65068.1 MAG: 5'/3'-nucleotidase SurE [Candidatus Omnitrophica bacterium CG12_big_fil_rev_8_21_14_0_65_45_16]